MESFYIETFIKIKIKRAQGYMLWAGAEMTQPEEERSFVLHISQPPLMGFTVEAPSDRAGRRSPLNFFHINDIAFFEPAQRSDDFRRER